MEILIVVAVVAIVGTLGWKFYDASTKKASLSNSSHVEDSVLPDTLPELTDLATVKEAALAEKPGVTVIHVELERSSDDTLVYKAQLSDGTVVVYDARTGAKIKTQTASEKSDELLPANFSGGVGFAKAIEAARTVKPTGTIQKVELELEAGVVVYSVRFTDKARVDVNAETGAVVRSKAAKTESTPAAHKSTTSETKSTPSHQSSTSTDDSDDDASHDSDDDGLSDSDDDDDVDGSDDDSADSADDSDGSSHSGSGRR